MCTHVARDFLIAVAQVFPLASLPSLWKVLNREVDTRDNVDARPLLDIS